MPTFNDTGAVATTSVPSVIALTEMQPQPQQPSWNTSQALSIPPKLVKRILELEFIDMGELLPDTWQIQDQEDQKCCHQRPGRRRGPILDILLWVECFSTMVSVLSTCFPHKTPQLMAYQHTIIKAHRAFTGNGWITYDTCYRRKAAVLKTLDWGVVDFTLYNETFTGRAKSIPRCRHCLSEHHQSEECSYAPDATPDRQPDLLPRTQRSPIPICQLFNGKQGNFVPCKFLNLCDECKGHHPAAYCRRQRTPTNKRHRSRSPRAKV